MKKPAFLDKMVKERKLRMVEPSENVAASYRQKSESYLDSSKLLLKNEKLEEAVSMAYYSMYYSLLSLLFKCGIKSENHTVSIILLKELFNIDNKKIAFAKKERVDKQYYVDFTITKAEVTDMIKDAESFVSVLFDFAERMKNDDVNSARRRLSGLLRGMMPP